MIDKENSVLHQNSECIGKSVRTHWAFLHFLQCSGRLPVWRQVWSEPRASQVCLQDRMDRQRCSGVDENSEEFRGGFSIFFFIIFSNFQCFDSITGEASVEMVGTSRFKQHTDNYQAHLFLVSWPWPSPSNARIIIKIFPVGFLTLLLSSGDVSLTMAVSSKYYVYPHNSEQFPTVTIVFIIVVFITITTIITRPQPAFGWRGLGLECIVEP